MSSKFLSSSTNIRTLNQEITQEEILNKLDGVLLVSVGSSNVNTIITDVSNNNTQTNKLFVQDISNNDLLRDISNNQLSGNAILNNINNNLGGSNLSNFGFDNMLFSSNFRYNAGLYRRRIFLDVSNNNIQETIGNTPSYNLNSGLSGHIQTTTRFFVPAQSQILFTYGWEQGVFQNAGDSVESHFGLRNDSTANIVYVSIIKVFEGNLIQIINTAADRNNVIRTETITQANFNIDVLDGLGISGHTYNPDFSSIKLFIEQNSNNLIFGLYDNNQNKIPFHSIGKYNTANSTTLPIQTRAWRMFQGHIFARLTGNVIVYPNDMRIFNRAPILFPNSFSYEISSPLTINTTETNVLAIQLKAFPVTANIKLKNLCIDSTKLLRVRFYHVESNSLVPNSITGGSFDETIESLTFNDTFTSFTAVRIFSCISDAIDVIDLSKHIDWKYFGYDEDDNSQLSNTIIMTFQSLETTSASVLYDLNWCET
jgi:hypothetical protein